LISLPWLRRDRRDASAVRWVVVDCETTGLDPARDRLLSVGAIAVRAGRIVLDEHFVAGVRQEAPANEASVLVHGIGDEQRRAGREPAAALGDLARFLEGGVAVGFHAAFDAAVLRREMSRVGLKGPPRWLDLAQLAPALFPGRPHKALDEWLGEFGIRAVGRHDALGDALATAELHLVLLAEAERQGARSVEQVHRLQGAARWLPRS
jgi:DNA polymerase-3 subunit epsilon